MFKSECNGDYLKKYFYEKNTNISGSTRFFNLASVKIQKLEFLNGFTKLLEHLICG